MTPHTRRRAVRRRVFCQRPEPLSFNPERNLEGVPNGDRLFHYFGHINSQKIGGPFHFVADVCKWRRESEAGGGVKV